MALNNEINELVKRLRLVSETSKRQTSRILGKNAKPITDALFVAAPHGKKTHKRYRKAGLNKSIRTPRGKGQVVAIYKPGNLATSFKLFRFKGAKYSIQVGAKFQKNPSGTFGPGGRQDAYYTHIVEQRSPFIMPTWLRMKQGVENGVIRDLKRVIERAGKK
jgi:hypothetical protein